MTERLADLRNKITHAVTEWVINHIATEEYREDLAFLLVLGLNELEQRKQDELDYLEDRKNRP